MIYSLKSCQPVTPPLARINIPSENGQSEVVTAKVRVNTRDCGQKDVTAQTFYYQSKKGYKGPDAVFIEVTEEPNGPGGVIQRKSLRVPVEVK